MCDIITVITYFKVFFMKTKSIFKKLLRPFSGLILVFVLIFSTLFALKLSSLKTPAPKVRVLKVLMMKPPKKSKLPPVTIMLVALAGSSVQLPVFLLTLLIISTPALNPILRLAPFPQIIPRQSISFGNMPAISLISSL